MSGRELAVYLGVTLTLGALVGAAAWFVLGWTTSLADEPRLFVASQVPVVLLLLAWFAAAVTSPKP